MHILLTALFFLRQPFWEAKAPEQWTDRQIEELRQDSPWAQKVGPAPEVLVWLATAAPIEEAEGEARLRTRNPLREPDPDYSYFLFRNREDHFVLAISLPSAAAGLKGLKKAGEEHRMLEESEMLVGAKSYRMTGYFPPTDSDPVLRLVFPREVKLSDKFVLFRLYLPGMDFPDREIQFRVKELAYHGKLEM
jgi:hypothetical protein